MTTALGKKGTTAIGTVSKETRQVDRRIDHAKQVFNAGLRRLEAAYHEALRNAVLPEQEAADTPVDQTAATVSTVEATA